MFSNIYVSANNVFVFFRSKFWFTIAIGFVESVQHVEHGRDEAADVEVWAEVDEGEEQDLFRGSSNIKCRECLISRLIRRKSGKMVKNEM